MAFYRVKAVGTGPVGGPFFQQFYFNSATGGLPQDFADGVTQFYSDLSSEVRDDLIWQVAGEVETFDLVTGNLTGVTSVSTTPVVGQSASEPLAAATQGLLSLRTGEFVGGREVRGRLFIAGPTEGDNVDGSPASAYRSAVEAAAANLKSTFVNQWCIYSPTKAAMHAVSSWSCWSQWAVLRSRRD